MIAITLGRSVVRSVGRSIVQREHDKQATAARHTVEQLRVEYLAREEKFTLEGDRKVYGAGAGAALGAELTPWPIIIAKDSATPRARLQVDVQHNEQVVRGARTRRRSACNESHCSARRCRVCFRYQIGVVPLPAGSSARA